MIKCQNKLRDLRASVRKFQRLTALGLLFLSLLPLTGCLQLGGEGPAAVVRYYVLGSVDPVVAKPGATAPHAQPLRLQLNIAPLPEYLDRSGIAVRDANRIFYAPMDRWSESLFDGVQRVLVEELLRQRPNMAVVTGFDHAANVTLHLHITRFEAIADGSVILQAVVTRSRADGGSGEVMPVWSASRPASSSDYADMVAAHNANLQALAAYLLSLL